MSATSPADRPRVVCLCGSMRFEEQMREIARIESIDGAIVVLPLVNMKQPHPLWSNDDDAEQIKAGLDGLHKRKIDLADEIIVVSDETGYVGHSTRSEIAYAEQRGKPVRYERLPAAVSTVPATQDADATPTTPADERLSLHGLAMAAYAAAHDIEPRQVDTTDGSFHDVAGVLRRYIEAGSSDLAVALGLPADTDDPEITEALEGLRRDVDRWQQTALAATEDREEASENAATHAKNASELASENDRLRRALAVHLFDREALSTREAIRLELIEQQHAELVRQRESRAALSSLLRDMARRVGQKREEIRELAGHLPCGWCNGTGIAPEESFGRDGDGAPMVDGDQPCPEGCAPSASDQTPATPDDAVQSAVVADLHERAERYRDRCVGKPSDGAHAFAAQVLDHLAMGYEIALPEPTAPSSVQGDTTPEEA